MKGSRIIISDSGGVQEEACILKVPLVTVRNSTERPETLSIGCNILSKINNKKIYRDANILLRRKNKMEKSLWQWYSSYKIL